MTYPQRLVLAVSTAALLFSGCGSTATQPPVPTPQATAALLDTPAPVPSVPSQAESSLLASMTARYDECSPNQPPSGLLVADATCRTVDGVRVDGAQYLSAAAASAAFKAQAGAKKGTRCSAGAYLGNYKVGGKTTGQLGCNGDATTIAWTVPKLRLYLSAYVVSLPAPALYAWWQRNWTVDSVSSTATTGEKAVPVAAVATPEPVAVVDTPAPVDNPPASTEPSPADVHPATPAAIRFNQTWTTPYNSTTCGDWNYKMTPEQRWTMAADLLYAVRGVTALPPDDLITEFGTGISTSCTPTDVLKVNEAAAALYTLAQGVYGP
jgi:hypothetical protein